ncbi:MAG: GtrA family protein [Actinomycetaceae bacterium]|nr:GtrA family protein [Actinomycetaceae bacterium]
MTKTPRPSWWLKTTALLREILAFLGVGGIAFLVDFLVYNGLVFYEPLTTVGRGILFHYPVAAKVIAIGLASCVTYIGNKVWTYGRRNTLVTTSSIVSFIIINLVASGLQLACLGFSRYVLSLSSLLSDNIFGTVIGQVLATSFRFFTYRIWVFPHNPVP